jgi:BirA family biotin operon repressor/biotin-[acetyl-CoA-carboxylase] ligase
MIQAWTQRLEQVVAGCTLFRRAIVVEETSSTQDEARRLGPLTGDVVVAVRQTAGRGRRGRSWADTRHEGIAVSFVVDAASSERLVLATAVGTLRAVEALVPRQGSVWIKWPNDLVAEGRKLAGILVEQDGLHAVIGVGVNVRQEAWSAELSGKAISMRQLGSTADRLDLVCGLVAGLDRSMQVPDAALAAAYAERDALAGRTVSVLAAGTRLVGRVLAADPRRGLVIDAGHGPTTLPAATTTVEWDES